MPAAVVWVREVKSVEVLANVGCVLIGFDGTTDVGCDSISWYEQNKPAKGDRIALYEDNTCEVIRARLQ